MAFSFLLSHVEVLSAHVHGSGGWMGADCICAGALEAFNGKPLKEEAAGGAVPNSLRRSEWWLSCHSGTENQSFCTCTRPVPVLVHRGQ